MTLNENWSRIGGDQRTEVYRTWRTTARLAGVSDVDQVEYRFVDGQLTVVALIELCVADMMSEQCPGGVRPGQDPSPLYFSAVESKVNPDRPQGTLLRLLAQVLNVPILLVVYIDGNLENRGVWVKVVDGSKGFEHYTITEYRKRLGKLGPQKPAILDNDQPLTADDITW